MFKIDQSCLDALPESLQAELRQAYAVQASKARDSNRGGNFMNLKQASPSKSPTKRYQLNTYLFIQNNHIESYHLQSLVSSETS